MAGIIAGLDTGQTPQAPNNPDHFVGMAPGSRIVSIKLADAHGTDRRLAGGRGHRLGHRPCARPGPEHPGAQPLLRHRPRQGRPPRPAGARRQGRLGPRHRRRRVRRQRRHCGRGARQPGALLGRARRRQPGHPRHDGHRDDTVASFSKRGNTGKGKRGPDVVAPGVSLVSLRAPGRTSTRRSAQGRVGDRFFKGSGTSQSAAVVSGAAALMLSERPQLTPDQLRDVLRRSARSLDGGLARCAG